MGANSILSNLTSKNTLPTIRMLLSGDIKKKRVIMIVEGDDDAKLFKFLVSDNVTIIKSYGAKGGIDNMIPKYFAAQRRVIAVRDKDYEEESSIKGIFYCDHCSCEMMMVSQDETFDKVATNYYRGNSSFFELRKEILLQLRFVSLLRKCSFKYRWGLKLNDINLGSFIIPGKKVTEEQTLICVNKYNRGNGVLGGRKKKLEEDESFDSKDLSNLMDITNGHDFLSVLAIYCRHYGKRGITDKELGGAIRCAFDRNAFSKTQLFRKLKEYQEEYGLIIVI